jgi:hypothetical protein
MLYLLREKFPEGISIPEAVWREVVNEGKGRPGAKEVSEANWINVHTVANKKLVQLLRGELDEGEAEAIILAAEQMAELVLLDERDARRAAMRMNLKVLGTVGILVWARKTGKINSLRSALDVLQRSGKFRFSTGLYEQALHEVGEQ